MAPDTSTSVDIRRAVLDDVPAIAVFQTRCWNEAYAGVVPADYLERIGVDERELRWRDRLISSSRLIAVAELLGEIVGVVSWGVAAEGPAHGMASNLELKSLYVASELRGSGLASELLMYAIGTRPAHLWVFRDNLRARAFYRKHGFQPDGSVATDADTELELVRMTRPTHLRPYQLPAPVPTGADGSKRRRW